MASQEKEAAKDIRSFDWLKFGWEGLVAIAVAATLAACATVAAAPATTTAATTAPTIAAASTTATITTTAATATTLLAGLGFVDGKASAAVFLPIECSNWEPSPRHLSSSRRTRIPWIGPSFDR